MKSRFVSTQPPAETITPHRGQRDAVSSEDKPLNSLLVPTDFSESSATGLDCAITWAKQFGARIDLVHVVESDKSSDYTSLLVSDWNKQSIENARKHLAELEQERIDEWIPADVEVRSGRPYREICEAARKHKSDLIVISTHGYTGLKHLLLGSTTERVVRHAPCSVLVVRGKSTQQTGSKLKLKRILVPTDFSKSSTQSVRYALALAKEFDAELSLLHVVQVYYPASEEMMRDVCVLETELRQSGGKRLAQLLEDISSKGIKGKSEVRLGRPATEITEMAAQTNSDLIVISSRGLRGWSRALLGSTTEEVVRYASCPVLVVRN